MSITVFIAFARVGDAVESLRAEGYNIAFLEWRLAQVRARQMALLWNLRSIMEKINNECERKQFRVSYSDAEVRRINAYRDQGHWLRIGHAKPGSWE